MHGSKDIMNSSFQQTGTSRKWSPAGTLFAMMVGVMLLGLASTAQADGYAFGLDLPLQFSFTGDLRGTAQPSGFKATLDTPFHVGVGAESYSVEADDAAGTILITIDYDFTDIYLWWRGMSFTIAAGFGTGGAAIQDYIVGADTFSADEADADQVFIALGWIINPRWEFHVGYHSIDAETDLKQNGVVTGAKLDLGGIMHSAGFKFIF